MAKKRKYLQPDEPLLHPDHPRPVSRRDFIRQGLVAGSGVTLGGGILSLFANPQDAWADLSGDIQALATASGCSVGGSENPNIPVICFDLAGGANIAGSNVLVGTQSQMDTMTTAAYSRLGIPDTMLPTDETDITTVNNELGLKFHAQSAMLEGIFASLSIGVRANIDGIVIPARSDNDTGNNPHNPMYGFAHAGGTGDIVSVIGSRNSESGGNSMAPVALMNQEYRPTKVDRPSDVRGMVDTGDLTAILGKEDVKAVMESIVRLSDKKLKRSSVQTKVTRDDVIKNLMRCGYLDAADLTDRFAGSDIDPEKDPHIVGAAGSEAIFTQEDFDADGEFRKTASVMKMVINGHSGAGTITMGGYDYHTGDRVTGERRDFRAGRCIGACLEYASRDRTATDGPAAIPTPVMIYVFSDGSVSSNGRIDPGANKGEWTSDNSSTAASFILVYRPGIPRDQILVPSYQATRQIGRFTNNGAVDTSSSPAANNVNLLANTVILNYMALNGNYTSFDAKYGTGFPGIFPAGVSHGLGSGTAYDKYVAFQSIK